MMGGILAKPEVAFEIISSKDSNNASDIGAWMSMSTGRPRSNAHLRLSTPSGVDSLKTVDNDVGTAERYDGKL